MATGNTSAPSNNANLLSIEKRLNAIEFDFKRMSSANDSGKSSTQFNPGMGKKKNFLSGKEKKLSFLERKEKKIFFRWAKSKERKESFFQLLSGKKDFFLF